MAFYNPKGFVPSFKHARAFAGEGGRVATLPDIIEARLATEPGQVPWEWYFTTLTAEYVGLSKAGNPIAIVAHGVGPMATLDGVLAAYGHEYKDKERQNRGGRISQEDFLRLESGGFGDVSVIDLAQTWGRVEYAFYSDQTFLEIEEEPLWQARLGAQWEKYVSHHTKFARDFHKKQGHPTYPRPCILSMKGSGYGARELFESRLVVSPGSAIANLLSISQLMHMHHRYDGRNRESLVSDVHTHDWSDGTRLVGVRPGLIADIHAGIPDIRTLLKVCKLDRLCGPNPKGKPGTSDGFWHLLKFGDRYFTDYPKVGESLDHCEAEFLVTKIVKLDGGPSFFRTIIGGHPIYFRYGVKEVQALAPQGANAYTIGEPGMDGSDHHIVPVRFYKVEVDTTRRFLRMDDIYRDYDLMMSLI